MKHFQEYKYVHNSKNFLNSKECEPFQNNFPKGPVILWSLINSRIAKYHRIQVGIDIHHPRSSSEGERKGDKLSVG